MKKNHIFLFIEDDRMHLRESNLVEHGAVAIKLSKRGRLKSRADLKKYTSENLEPVASSGINPYKLVELWKNYRDHVPPIYHGDILYQKPPAEVMALVKEEKSTRSVFRAKIKELKAGGMKAMLESVAYEDCGDGNDGVEDSSNNGVMGGDRREDCL